MPLLILGIVPSIIGLIIGHGGIIMFGIFFTIAAGGDIIALFMLRKLDNNETYISDHPNKMGFYREINEDIESTLDENQDENEMKKPKRNKL